MDTADRILQEMAKSADDAFDIGRLLFERANDPKPDSAKKMIEDTLAVMSGAATLAAQDKINAYANAMTQRDKEARHEGRPEQDLDVVGRALRAGT